MLNVVVNKLDCFVLWHARIVKAGHEDSLDINEETCDTSLLTQFISNQDEEKEQDEDQEEEEEGREEQQEEVFEGYESDK